jgi:hypothetical protein
MGGLELEHGDDGIFLFAGLGPLPVDLYMQGTLHMGTSGKCRCLGSFFVAMLRDLIRMSNTLCGTATEVPLLVWEMPRCFLGKYSGFYKVFIQPSDGRSIENCCSED